MLQNRLQARSRLWRTGLAALASVGALLAGLAMAAPASAANYVQLHVPYQGVIKGYDGLCLDDAGDLTTNLNPIILWQCNTQVNQTWTVFQSPDNADAVIIALPETLLSGLKCLDIYQGGTANGTPVELYTCNNGPNQDWIPLAGGALYNPNSGKCLDDPAYQTNGAQLQIYTCHSATNQVWLGYQ